MEKNFTLIKEDMIEWDGRTLYRIKCIKDIPYHNVKVGDLGGYVENEDNLNENAWVSINAWVFGNARVFANAWVSGNAIVSDWVSDNVRVYDNAWVFGNARVSGSSRVFGNVRASEYVKVYDNAWVFGNARAYANAKVYGDARVYGNARVYGYAWVFDNAKVYGDARVYGSSKVSDDAKVIKGCVNMGIPCPITITHNHILIGCKFLKIEEWEDYLGKNWENYNYNGKHYQPIKIIIDLAKELKKEGTI
jgi:carbonic anhydrase/acetyltransferase-like protein (isoleucine patch superfamily)